MSMTDARPRLAALFARKGDARPAARHPLAGDQPRRNIGAASGPTGIDWREVIANSRELDLPIRDEPAKAQREEEVAETDLSRLGLPALARPTAAISQCRAPAACAAAKRPRPDGEAGAEGGRPDEPLAFKTAVKLSARQRQILRIASAVLDIPQQALIRSALDVYFEHLRKSEMRGCGCFEEKLRRRQAAPPVAAGSSPPA
ncbi:MAG: hypothetical protein GC152_11050 [Alphaproteobacteria bacterium]|nr:hypothetical protein [Alphaproteobacteria bacterium]